MNGFQRSFKLGSVVGSINWKRKGADWTIQVQEDIISKNTPHPADFFGEIY